MTALCFNGYLKIGISLFGNAYAGKVALQNSLDICRNDCAALVKRRIKANSSVFKCFHYIVCAVVCACNNFLVVAKAEINSSFGCVSLLKQCFDSLHNANKVVFHIKGASAPNKFAVIITLKRRVFPIIFGSCRNRHNILVRQKRNAVQIGICALPSIKQCRLRNFFAFERFVSQRIFLFEKIVKFFKFAPIDLAVVGV